MKKLSLIIIAVSAASFLLSSCSRLENLAVSKRHYRSGFYVDLGSIKRAASTPQVSKSEPSTTNSSASVNVDNKSPVSPENKIDITVPVVSSDYVVKKKQAQKHSASNIYASTQGNKVTEKDMQSVSTDNSIATVQNASPLNSTSSSSSAPFWVILLFAIIIPPLGVALKFGIVDKFWISLLLTIIFWLPGAIYSIIVVTE